MQFWPGKMKMWFAKPTKADGSDSAMGKVEQAYTEVDGKKILQWRKTSCNQCISDVMPMNPLYRAFPNVILISFIDEDVKQTYK